MTGVVLLLALAQAPMPGCPEPSAPPAMRATEDLANARLTLLRCVRADLQQGRWADAETRLASARRAGTMLTTTDARAWYSLVDRLTATRIVDARSWEDAPALAAAVAESSPWLHQMVTALAEARIAWRRQDAPVFARLLNTAHQLRELGRARQDVEITRAGLLLQAAVAGGQYERDEMQLLLEDAQGLEQQLITALGEAFVPVVLARELEADLWLQTDRFLKAAEVYRAVIAEHPARVQSWMGLATAYRRLGYTHEADIADAQARRLAPAAHLP